MSTTIGFVDPYKLAAQQQSLHGKCLVTDMERVSKFLLDKQAVQGEQPELVYAINFALDADKICVISGELSGNVTLCCQRCLQPFSYMVHCEFAVSPVLSDDDAKELPSSYEPALLIDGKLDLLEMFEDELILALPQVPMHDLAVCVAANPNRTQGAQEQEMMSPFHVLQKLKLKEDK